MVHWQSKGLGSAAAGGLTLVEEAMGKGVCLPFIGREKIKVAVQHTRGG